jgi:CcdB protein
VAQFDAYRTRRSTLVVCLQSDLIDAIPMRLVAPLQPAAGAMDASLWRHLGTLIPRVTLDGRELVVDITRMVAVPVGALTERVGSCAAAGDEILRAVSILINGT